VDSGEYNHRKFVINLFDTVLHRKARPEEIAKFSKLPSESAILAAVVKDYDVLPSSSQAPKPAAAPSSDADASKDAVDVTKESFTSEPQGMEIGGLGPAPINFGALTDTIKGDGKVCIDKTDLIARLRSITTEANQLYHYILML
jgi:hypothetical protein